jgi:hypothetical protein
MTGLSGFTEEKTLVKKEKKRIAERSEAPRSFPTLSCFP